MAYAVFLRGINVSGKNLIPMARLREILRANGFDSARTYIQSGNIVLESPEEEAGEIGERISQLIRENLDLEVPAVAVKILDLKKIQDAVPFSDNTAEERKMLYFVFPFSEPSAQKTRALEEITFQGEAFRMAPGVIYLRLENGMGRAKCTNNFFEHTLGIKATTRNYRTVEKMLELASEL